MVGARFVDLYTWKARVYPALLVIAPALVTGTAIFGDHLTELSGLMSILVAVGVLYLLSHLVRQAGKSKEPRLWRSWGGKPTTVGLRWRTNHATISCDLVRARLAQLAPDLQLPTAEEERADPAEADRLYDAAVSVLREATRDQSRFPIVFAENVSYGFRRNAWAIRPLGVCVAVACVGSTTQQIIYPPGVMVGEGPALWAAAFVNALFAVFWLFIATERWVMQAAEAYTNALFSATSVLVHR